MLKRREGSPVDSSRFTGDDEMTEIMHAQEREYEWWKDIPAYASEFHILKAEREGELQALDEEKLEKSHFRISANTAPDLKYLRPNVIDVIMKLGIDWAKNMKKADESMERTFLVLTSFVRTIDYQQELADRGYPAAEGDKSTHLRGGAVDIGIGWLEDNRPKVVELLKQTLSDMQEIEGLRLNVIYEESVRAIHIAVHPDGAYPEEQIDQSYQQTA